MFLELRQSGIVVLCPQLRLYQIQGDVVLADLTYFDIGYIQKDISTMLVM